MDDIKFRQAIYTLDGEFYRWHYWGFIDGGFVGPDLGGIRTIEQAKKNSFQYIGLKDTKNKKEMWEGDIIVAQDFGSDDGVRGVIIIEDGAFNIKPKNVAHCSYCCAGWYCTEIIGNVVEHPHLLNEKL